MDNVLESDSMPATPAVTELARGWLVLLAATLGAGVCSTAVILMTSGVFIRALNVAFQWNRAQVAGSLSICALALGLVSPWIGALIDRIGSRPVLLVSLLSYGTTVMCVPMLIHSLALPGLYLGFLLIGVLSSGSNTVVYLRVVSEWFDKSRGFALGVSMAGVALGGALCAPLAAIIVQRFGWASGYYVLGALPIVVGIPLGALLLRESPVRHANLQVKQSSAGQVEPYVRQETNAVAFRLILIAAFLMAITINGAQTHLVPMLMDKGIDLPAAALATTMLAIFAIVGRISAGFLFDRVFAPRAAIVIFGLSCIGCAGLYVTSSSTAVYVCAALIGLGAGAESDLLGYLVGRYFGLQRFGRIFGRVFASFMLGSALGPVAFGIGFDRFQSYDWMLAGATVGLLTVCALCALMPPFPRPD